MWISDATVFLSICLVVVWITNVIQWRKKNQKMRTFMASNSGPFAVPVIGSVFEIAEFAFGSSQTLVKRFLDQMKRWDQKRGTYWILHNPYLLTSDRLIFQAVLLSSKHIDKTEDCDFLKLHASGILTKNGPAWRSIRRTYDSVFRRNMLWSHQNAKNIDYHTKVFHKKLTEYAAITEPFDLLVTMLTCTIDLAYDNLLGHRIDAQESGQLHFAKNFITSSLIILERVFRIPMWPNLIFSLSGRKRKLEDAMRPVRNITTKIFEEKLERRAKLKGEANADTDSGGSSIFMDIMLDKVESGDLTRQEAIEECIEMYLASSITTGTIASWVFKIFAMRPDIQQEVYKEIVEVCGQKITLDDVSKLVCLEMVVKETLRHFSLPFISRHIEEDITLEDGTTLPAGLNIIFMLHTLHHDPDYWQKPGEFYPEHFSPINELNRPKGVFLPFSTGPRSCPGRSYAMTSMRYLIANTLLQYEFFTEEKPPADFTTENYLFMFMLIPLSGFHVKVKERRSKIGTMSLSQDAA